MRKVSKVKRSYLEGHEEISEATTSPRRAGGPEAEKDVSQDNCSFPSRKEDLEIEKDISEARKCLVGKEGSERKG